ncbi:phosphate ABC transporter substrate-binding protein PstS [Azospirillum sp. A1-3]|uniref:phosphate ABC transporter substrate-binding protein PstS n=1 Tax=unclassified Azospirillum TaxID=2630922 RepID=UPI000D618F0F|nr:MULTISPECIES: phosphate ABC transporter substrate-binding protein PstS [unclassified Azospirillum]MCM8739029.1 phosphate ABC transporter substrate-binding protein PstS [Azospirillum sp. A1-3]PWC96256.1 phosphate ABC transporter substrate-binding protein [Azospirillum sp. TSO5]
MTSAFVRCAAFGALAALSVSVAPLSVASAADISGAGATFPYPIYAKWADAYKKETGTGLNYQSIGSGGGIKQIKAKTVTFGASDMPLKPEELEQAGLIQFPMIMGGVVPVVNLKGIKSGEVKLSGTVLANIYMGEITKWNDAQIKALNPNVNLPNTAIAPVYRSDGSGTNFLFTDYLSKTSPKFKTQIGANTSVQWPAGIGAKGNEGVANMVKQTDGSIGYVEYAYAKQNNITHLDLQNKDGKTVAPKIEAFQAAAANADWANAKGYYVLLTDEPGAESWPITGASFILMYKNPQDASASGEALKFFDWAYKNGGKMAAELDYVPMPDSVVSLVQKTWSQTIQADGKPVWTASAK